MDPKEQKHRSGYHNRIYIFILMAGLCILALIEIAYGQRQLKLERERQAMLEEDHRAVQELKQDWENIKDTGEVVTETVLDEEPATEPEQTVSSVENNAEGQDTQGISDGNEGTETEEEADGGTSNDDKSPYDMQIVFMGDSILESDNEFDNISTLVAGHCNAKVYNMAMGGTTAALPPNYHYNSGHWTSWSLLGIVNAILGDIDGSIFDGYPPESVLKECDFDQTDYFVIEYGINDFLSKIPKSRYLAGGETLDIDGANTYVGALESSIVRLHNRFPDAKIVLITPHYCQFFDKDHIYLGDAYSLDYGEGTLIDYARVCGYVGEVYKDDGVMLLFAMEQSGINANTADWYLEDGIHLNAAGRRLYADYISQRILWDFWPQE